MSRIGSDPLFIEKVLIYPENMSYAHFIGVTGILRNPVFNPVNHLSRKMRENPVPQALSKMQLFKRLK
jgi:hypothetical protein